MNNSSISIKNTSKYFQQPDSTLSVFNNISYTFQKGKSYAIIGTSGVGKSTLLHMLAGIEQPSQGSIMLNSLCISTVPLKQKIPVLQKFIGLIFQQSLLIQELTIIENVMLKAIIKHGITNKDIKHAQELLCDVDLLDKANNMPNTLSGGQQQRIAVLRAIFQTPHFLLADEPTGNLDISTGKKTTDLLLRYQKKYHMGLIISTHDLEIAQQMDYVLKIEKQNIIEVSNI